MGFLLEALDEGRWWALPIAGAVVAVVQVAKLVLGIAAAAATILAVAYVGRLFLA